MGAFYLTVDYFKQRFSRTAGHIAKGVPRNEQSAPTVISLFFIVKTAATQEECARKEGRSVEGGSPLPHV